MRITATLVAFLLCGCSGEFSSDPAHLRSADEKADLEELVQSLESIKAWHSENETGITASLRPGLSGPELEPELLFGRCTLSDELKALWTWHDGARTDVPFVWYHDFLPLEDAVSEYRWLLLNPFVRWDPEYIPILSFEGEWYGAFCGSRSGGTGPIVHYYLEDGARVMATNLTTFLAMMAEVFSSNAVEWTDGGMVESIDKVREIHRQRNPGLEFPYRVPDDS